MKFYFATVSIPMRHPEALAVDHLYEIYMQQVKQYPLLSRQEEQLLGHLVQDGDREAHQQLVLSNLRLVVRFVQRYRHQTSCEVLDLIQAGNIGLMRAVTRFRPELGFRLSTYAGPYIRGQIIYEMEQRRLIKLGNSRSDQVGTMLRADEQLTQQLQRQPTTPELAEALTISEAACQRIMRALVVATPGESLDEHAQVADADVSDVESEAVQQVHAEHVRQLMSEFSAECQAIIKLRFGFDTDHCHSYTEISRQLDLPYERVRVTCVRVLERCRQSDKWQACNQID